jgi:hypothetical protein
LIKIKNIDISNEIKVKFGNEETNANPIVSNCFHNGK